MALHSILAAGSDEDFHGTRQAVKRSKRVYVYVVVVGDGQLNYVGGILG